MFLVRGSKLFRTFSVLPPISSSASEDHNFYGVRELFVDRDGEIVVPSS
jgi:hypothetical protein